MKNLFFSLFVLLATTCVHAQIPVTDVAMNTNTVTNQILNGATWGNQLLELEQQATVLTKTLKFVTDVSSAVRDIAYAKSLLERQQYIIRRCSDIVTRADKVDLRLAHNLTTSVESFLVTNNSLITLLNSTLTSRFKMNDSERLKTLMDVKKEQEGLLEKLHTTDMILTTTMSTMDIIEFQILK